MRLLINKTNDILFILMLAYIFMLNFAIKGINDILFILLLLVFIINIYHNKNNLKKLPKWIYFSVGLFCLSLLLLSFTSPNIQESFKIVRRLIKYIFPFIIIFYCINDKKKIEILFFTLLGSIFLEIIYSLLVNSSNFYNIIFNNMSYRMQGYPPEPGKWPTFMLFSMKLEIFVSIIYILLLIQKQIINKLITFVPLLIGLIALFFNNTRMAWLIIALMFIIISCLCIKNKKFLVTLLFSISIFSLGIIYTQPWIQQRIDNTFYMKDSSSQLHYMFVQDSLEMIKEKPIMGWGIGQFSKYYNESFRSDKTNELIEKYHENTPVPYAHNMIIDLMVETGILGTIPYIICYSCFLFFSFKDWYKQKSISGLIFFSITLCFILHGFSEKTLDFNIIVQYFYCFLGMYLIYRNYELRR